MLVTDVRIYLVADVRIYLVAHCVNTFERYVAKVKTYFAMAIAMVGRSDKVTDRHPCEARSPGARTCPRHRRAVHSPGRRPGLPGADRR